MSAPTVVPLGLRALGAFMLAQGVWMVISPGTFFDVLGPFGERNDHYLRDNATWALTLGVLALLAAPRPSWRLPVLAFAAVQSGLHAVNHVVDVGEADPGWVGVFDAVALGLVTVLLVLLLRRPANDHGGAR
jgi:peptidoglycan/LPS O-acetylase OafA/YrhL